MTVSYVAYTWSGHRVTGTLEVDNLDAAYMELERDELVPYRLREIQSTPSFVERYPGLFKPKPQNLIEFSVQLSSLLKSGVPLRRSLMTLNAESRTPGLRIALKKVDRRDRVGETVLRCPGGPPLGVPRILRPLGPRR